jgi:hypothetical protein
MELYILIIYYFQLNISMPAKNLPQYKFRKWKDNHTRVLEDDEIFKYVKPTFTTNELYSVFNKIMKPVFPHMDRHRTKTYFHLRFDNSDMGLRKFFNSVRGFDDPSDIDTYAEKFTNTYILPTGKLYYFLINEESGRTGDPEDYYHVYKFLPNDTSLLDPIREKIMEEWPGIHNLSFSMMSPGSILSWHTDEHFAARYHHVIEKDNDEPSMVFKRKGDEEVTNISAIPGDCYIANVKIPHCVLPCKSTRIHLLGCLPEEKLTSLYNKEDVEAKQKDSRHGFLVKENTTWTEWAKKI